ncbi:Uncharacterised protein r2_g1377 [Pycnogonum litorale]
MKKSCKTERVNAPLARHVLFSMPAGLSPTVQQRTRLCPLSCLVSEFFQNIRRRLPIFAGAATIHDAHEKCGRSNHFELHLSIKRTRKEFLNSNSFAPLCSAVHLATRVIMCQLNAN